MSAGGAYGDEVHSVRHISDEDAGRLLGGDLQAGDSSLDELAVFVRDVGAAYSAPPTGPVRARHLDAMRWAARSRTDGRSVGPGLPERVRRTLVGLAPRPRLAGALAVLLLCASFSGLTAAGALPEPVQAAVADAARAVGVSVPDPRPERKPHPRRRTQPAPRSRQTTPAPQASPRSSLGPRRQGAAVTPPGEAAPALDGCEAEDCTDDGWQGDETLDPPAEPPLSPPADLPATPPADAGAAIPPQGAQTEAGPQQPQAGEPAP